MNHKDACVQYAKKRKNIKTKSDDSYVSSKKPITDQSIYQSMDITNGKEDIIYSNFKTMLGKEDKEKQTGSSISIAILCI